MQEYFVHRSGFLAWKCYSDLLVVSGSFSYNSPIVWTSRDVYKRLAKKFTTEILTKIFSEVPISLFHWYAYLLWEAYT